MESYSHANDANNAPDDIRDQLRKDHEMALAELEALRYENDEKRGELRLERLRQMWVIHALAEETVLYRALESVQSSDRADERFSEHEAVSGLFDKLALARPGSLQWSARLIIVRELIQQHIASERAYLLPRLSKCVDETGQRELGHRFRLAHQKLTLLEQAKAAEPEVPFCPRPASGWRAEPRPSG